ncbi:hypothetical protein F3Y22_tig00110270pilonHSYRG00073 [Hibiscus syriacus]|uniref:Uncharacterized protein n=1 Tax=Hibiscus syriacus TaxID=106335 RepID=A0A6A3B902_HIBSY|nr:hypothetical protein F3Y22_tig00110270pilonHSYRG00073 [Hibiscus syriacus]
MRAFFNHGCDGLADNVRVKVGIILVDLFNIVLLAVGRHVFPASYKRLHVPCTSQHAGHPRPSDRGHPNELCEGNRASYARESEGNRARVGRHALRATYPRSVALGFPHIARSVALGCHHIARSDDLGRMASDALGWPRLDGLGRMASDAQRVGKCMEHTISCRSPGRHGDLVENGEYVKYMEKKRENPMANLSFSNQNPAVTATNFVGGIFDMAACEGISGGDNKWGSLGFMDLLGISQDFIAPSLFDSFCLHHHHRRQRRLDFTTNNYKVLHRGFHRAGIFRGFNQPGNTELFLLLFI